MSILQSLRVENLVILSEKTKGKSYALNTGNSHATYDYIVTVDADTYLLPNALTALVSALLSGPSHTAAIAGSIYVKNSRENLLTRIQEYDYFHAIAAIKRMQSLFQGTLVAQGAFSLYKKNRLMEIGGWRDTLGEDIVLTWGLLEKGYRVDFSENAIAFTNAPTTYKEFYHQRRRWSRGMIEAFLFPSKNINHSSLNDFFNLLEFIFSCYRFLLSLCFFSWNNSCFFWLLFYCWANDVSRFPTLFIN